MSRNAKKRLRRRLREIRLVISVCHNFATIYCDLLGYDYRLLRVQLETRITNRVNILIAVDRRLPNRIDLDRRTKGWTSQYRLTDRAYRLSVSAVPGDFSLSPLNPLCYHRSSTKNCCVFDSQFFFFFCLRPLKL